MNRPCLTILLLFLAALLTIDAARGHAQDGPVSGSSVGGVRSGRSLREDSRPVGAGSRTVREGSVGSMHSGPVRGSSRNTMRSGPVSDVSVGPARSGGTLGGASESIGESSVGAVKKDLGAPLGERITESLTDMEQLQEQLRAVQPVPRFTPLPSEREEAEAQAAAQEEEQAAGEEALQVEGYEEPEMPGETSDKTQPEPLPQEEPQPESEAPTPAAE